MKKILSVVALAVAAQNLFAGDITGTVRAAPKAGVENSSGGGGAYDSKKYKFVPRVDYSQMREFVVFIEGKVGANAAPATNVVAVTTSRVAQKSAQFAPHILPVLAGTMVEWPNNDDIFHNVFSISELKSFDLDLYKGNPPDKRVTFDRPGKVLGKGLNSAVKSATTPAKDAQKLVRGASKPAKNASKTINTLTKAPQKVEKEYTKVGTEVKKTEQAYEKTGKQAEKAVGIDGKGEHKNDSAATKTADASKPARRHISATILQKAILKNLTTFIILEKGLMPLLLK